MQETTSVPNAVRSATTRAALVSAAVDSLVAIGYSRTTGVEVCRRAGVTRGALQHHFPDFGQLLAAALGTVYDRLLVPVELPDGMGPLERWVLQAETRVAEPEFKAVIELWIGSQDDPELGGVLADAMAQGAGLFGPSMILDRPAMYMDELTERTYRTITEAFIGLGLGIATNGGRPLGHHQGVVATLRELARAADRRHGLEDHAKGDPP